MGRGPTMAPDRTPLTPAALAVLDALYRSRTLNTLFGAVPGYSRARVGAAAGRLLRDGLISYLLVQTGQPGKLARLYHRTAAGSRAAEGL
jgi:hypothetical protein